MLLSSSSIEQEVRNLEARLAYYEDKDYVKEKAISFNKTKTDYRMLKEKNEVGTEETIFDLYTFSEETEDYPRISLNRKDTANCIRTLVHNIIENNSSKEGTKRRKERGNFSSTQKRTKSKKNNKKL